MIILSVPPGKENSPLHQALEDFPMTSTTHDSDVYQPLYLAATFIATPVLFFAFLAWVGPLVHFASYLLVAWTIAALATATPFAIDRRYMNQFTNSERLALVAGNGLLAISVAATGFMAFAA